MLILKDVKRHGLSSRQAFWDVALWISFIPLLVLVGPPEANRLCEITDWC